MTSNARLTTARRGVASLGATVGLAVAMSLGSPWLTVDQAFAATGALLQTVNIPLANQCLTGISVTTVPGSLIGENRYPILLVYSCWGGGATSSRLHFLDPSTGPVTTGTLVKTIETTPTPALGWGSLSLRGGRGDILACGDESDGTRGLYVIDVNPLNATPDGTATPLFNKALGTSPCDGVAWDNEDNTVFHSPESSNTIYHFSETGDPIGIGSFPAPAGCPNSGLAVGGDSLFAACNGVLTIYQLNKTDGSVITSFPSAGNRTEDLECDPTSFASQGVDAIWSKDAFTNQIFAFEIPSGTCGVAGASQVPEPVACASDGDTDPVDTPGHGNPDNDGDALLDCWEDPAIAGGPGIDFNGDGTIDLPLPRANKDHKDIFVEVDWMDQHEPIPTVTDGLGNLVPGTKDLVTAAFNNAPVSNPDGTTGIHLHVQVDEKAIDTHQDRFAAFTCGGTPNFDSIKLSKFGTNTERLVDQVNNCQRPDGSLYTCNPALEAKRWAYHYALFVHDLLCQNVGTSGDAEMPGNDFVVSLGGQVASGLAGYAATDVDPGQGVVMHRTGDQAQQAGTFMHELGHNLGLGHGGVAYNLDDTVFRDSQGNTVPEDRNCKPNYLSVMNYIHQIGGWYVSINRPLDYSRSFLRRLNEGSLNESDGIGGTADWQTAFGPPPITENVSAGGAINWNLDNDSEDTGVNRDINDFLDGTNGLDNCPGTGASLAGSDDWTHLRYGYQGVTDFAEGVHLSAVPELNIEEAAEVSPDTDGDGVVNVLDNCPLNPNPGQVDSDGDGRGDHCTIDIKPGTFPNSINRRDKKGSTPVALLSTPDMGVDVADPDTVEFAGAPPTKFSGDKDVNGDGLRDLVFHFLTQSLTLPPGTTEACLTGLRLSGAPIVGCDSVVVVK